MRTQGNVQGVILDADSLGPGDLDMSPVTSLLDDWEIWPVTAPGEISERIANADIVLTNKIPLSRETLFNAPNLEFVSVLATGYNHIDLDAARKRGVVVANAVAYATPAVVQHTISFMLALSNNLVSYVEAVRAGRWQASDVFCVLDFPIRELAGKKLGIVGYGELGRNVASVATAFGMEVLIAARPGQTTSGTEGRVPFDELLGDIDYLSLHCPLTPETENLIDENALGAMKSSAFLINTARGGLVDGRALLDALDSGAIAGAALDVVPTEPPPASDILTNARRDNLLITPHSAWGAIESRRRLIDQTRENIEGFLAGSAPRRLT